MVKLRKGILGRMRKDYNLGQVAQLVRALSLYAKVAGSIALQGTYKNQPTNV